MTVRSIFSISLLCAVVSVSAAQNRQKTHAFRFQNTELSAALDSLIRWYAVPLIYLENDVAGKQVTAECENCGFEEALQKITEGHGLLSKRVGDQVLLRTQTEAEIPTGTFAGTIRDSLTGEGIAGAEILLLDPISSGMGDAPEGKIHRWCSANRFGFFSLRNIRPGDYVLQVRRIGYQPVNEPVRIPPASALVHDVVMLERELVFHEVTVVGRRSGFSALEGISRGVFIRGTPSDYNQYLIEGARIYNPLHFGGVMSTFQGDALRDVQAVAGGIPPYYGGRIGGILDVALRDGRGETVTGSATIGSLGSNLFLEGQLLNRTSFLVSGRRAYPDVFFPRYQSWYGTKETPGDLRSSEVMAKITHHLSKDERISLTGYTSRDTYGSSASDSVGTRLINALQWGNTSANMRWMGVVSPSLFFYASAIYTRYGFEGGHRFGVEMFPSDYSIEDAAVRAHAEYFYDEHHTVLAGVELVRHRMRGKVSEFSSQIAPMSFDGFSPWELAVYFQDQWRLAPSVLAEAGGRATSFIANQGSFSAIDPRFSLLVSLTDDLRLFSSFSAVSQFIHPYRNSGIFLFYPSIFLYPSTETIRPSTSLQVSLGAEKNFGEDQYRVAAESYYRMTQNLHEFVFDSTMAGTLPDRLLLGEGNVYGIEVTLEKRFGDVTGSIRYGYSWANNRFSELNGGQPFRPRFDRRHELYAAASYSPSGNWAVEMTCLLSANQFPSFVPGGLDAQAPAETRETGLVAIFSNSQYAEPYDLNGGRLPGFQRLEFRALHRFSWWGLRLRAMLRLLNGYGLTDPFVWETRPNPDNRLRWAVKFDAPPIFPLYPVISMSVKF